MSRFQESKSPVYFTIVLTIVAIACGLLIGGINAWTAPIIEENNYQRKVASYQAVLPDMNDFTVLSIEDDPASIQEKVEAKNAQGEVIGYIINIDQKNGYGNMQIVIAIAADGTIISADFLQLNQTLNLENTRANLAMYVGSNINSSSSFDFLSGATRSLETLTAMMGDIKTAFGHIDIALDEDAIRLARYQELYTDTASFTELDTSTDPNSIIVKAALYNDAEALIGYAIEASASNDYGLIHTVIITDTDGVILYADYVDLDQSMFQSESISNLALYVGTTITDETPDGTLLTSATYSLETLEALITDTSSAFGHIDMEGAGA